MRAQPPRLQVDADAPRRSPCQYEFCTEYLLCCSDPEPLTLQELLDVADADSRARYDSMVLGYTESQGMPELREAIAEQYTDVAAEDLLVIAPEEGVYLAMTALGERLLAEGKTHVVCTSPAYQSLYQILESTFGLRVSFWEPRVDPADGVSLCFDVEDLEALVEPGQTGIVVINFPHNPSGCMLTPEEQARVAAVANGAGAAVFSDEMYRGVEHGGRGTLPSFADIDVERSSLCLGGLSKTYGLPGLRMGWIATRDRTLMTRMRELRDFTTICSPGPSEVLALAAVRAAPELQGRVKARVAQNVVIADEFFAERENIFAWAKGGPAAATFAMCVTGRARTCAHAHKEAVGPEHVRGCLQRWKAPLTPSRVHPDPITRPHAPRRPRFKRDGADAEVLSDAIVEEASVLLLPATALDFGRPEVRARARMTASATSTREVLPLALQTLTAHSQYFRFGLGRADFEEALGALGDACEMDAVLDLL